MSLFEHGAYVFTFLALLTYTDCLKCYQCGDSSLTGSCFTGTAEMEAEYKRFNASENKDLPVSDGSSKDPPYQFLKECVSESDACIIERIEEQGQIHAYIRDCWVTGRNFSIQDERFNDIDPGRNHSVCIYQASSKRVACVRLCNKDFCNGPQIENSSSVTSLHPWTVFALILISICKYFQIL